MKKQKRSGCGWRDIADIIWRFFPRLASISRGIGECIWKLV